MVLWFYDEQMSCMILKAARTPRTMTIHDVRSCIRRVLEHSGLSEKSNLAMEA